MKWLNLLSVVLQFLAFWLVAPEFIGEEGLKKFEDLILKFVDQIPNVIITLLGTVFGYAFAHIIIDFQIVEQSSLIKKIGLILIIVLFVLVLIYKNLIELWLITRVANPIILKLRQEDIRRNTMLIGAAFFTLGFILQVIVILQS